MKTQNDLVSVIVPVYNVEKYIHRCLDSILSQTYKNLEILLIDDGSTDKSGKICDEYAKKDKRIKVIHQKNQGVSVARNNGLKKTNGGWIAFVDSDDYIESEYVEILLNNAEEKNADVVQCEQKIFNERSEVALCGNRLSIAMDGLKACEKMLYQDTITSALWGKLIRKSLFSGVSFKKDIIHEDLDVLYFILKKAEKVYYTSDPLYCYNERERSLIRKNFSERTLDVLDVMDGIIKDSARNKLLHEAAISRKVNADFYVLRQLPKDGYEDLRNQLQSEIKQHRKELLHNPEVRKKTIVALRLSYFGMPIVKLLFKVGKSTSVVRRVN
ncbi:glycosyltransferase [Candidatus Saccharibacteria bacterium]|nr:glycosyltransferase [Candidatus Saccharibacteria bacterium]